MERKEAIEVIKKNWPDSSFTMLREALETLVPELKESEDEKIRKLLVETVTQVLPYQYCSNRGVSKEKVVAWLEKQAEQKPAEWNTNDEQMLNSTIKDLIHPCYEEIPDRIEEEIKWIKSMKNRVVSQPKPTWSEEDKRKIDRIYSILRQAADTHAFSTTCRLIGDKECIELQDFLKSLKDRVLPQPKQEWSEDDRKLIDETCDLINTLASGYGEKVTEPISFSGAQQISNIKTRLKALVDSRPQNRWKPSEEMLEALYRVIPENVMEISEDEMLLDKLYQGLKYGRVLSKK